MDEAIANIDGRAQELTGLLEITPLFRREDLVNVTHFVVLPLALIKAFYVHLRNFVSILIQLLMEGKVDSRQSYAVNIGQGMLTHSQIWAAIDALAIREGLTPSSLAKLAGLDPTTFNRSKRQKSEGQLRWPSTESIAKVLAATGAGVDEFLLMIPHPEREVRRVPFRILKENAEDWFDLKGNLAGGWDEIAFPSITHGNVFALEVKGHQFAPVFRDGDIILADPKIQTRRGDRIFLQDNAGAIKLATLGHQTVTHLHLSTLQDNVLEPHALDNVRMIAKITWVSL